MKRPSVSSFLFLCYMVFFSSSLSLSGYRAGLARAPSVPGCRALGSLKEMGQKVNLMNPLHPPKINFQSDLLAGGSMEPWDPRPCLRRPGWRCVKRVCLRSSYKETISPQLLFVPHVSSVIFFLVTQRRRLIKFLCAWAPGPLLVALKWLFISPAASHGNKVPGKK